MKKIFIILAVIGFMTSGCSEWLDVNADPNVPTEVSTDLLLPAGQAGLAVPLGGHLFNTFWIGDIIVIPQAESFIQRGA